MRVISSGIWNSRHMFKKMTIKVHHDKDSKNSKSIRLLGSFFWAPILQRNKILQNKFQLWNLGVEVDNVQLSIELLSIESVLAPLPGARAPVGVHLPSLGPKVFFFKSFIEIHLEHSRNGSSFQAASFCRKVDLPCVTIVGHSQSRTLI